MSSMRRLIQELVFWALGESFKIALCVAPQTWYVHDIQIKRVIRWPLFLFNYLRTVLIQASWSDTCSAHRAPLRLAESAIPSGSSRLCTLQ